MPCSSLGAQLGPAICQGHLVLQQLYSSDERVKNLRTGVITLNLQGAQCERMGTAAASSAGRWALTLSCPQGSARSRPL